MGDLAVLRRRLGAFDRVVVAFSGGVDSSLLAWVAHDTLGAGRVVAATAVSASLAPSELDACRELAGRWGLRWVPVTTEEVGRPEYVANGADRCYHCKAELMERLAPLAGPGAAAFARPGAAAFAGPGAAAFAEPGASRVAETGQPTAVIALGVNLDDLGEHRPGQGAARERGAVFPLVDAGFTKADVRATARQLGLAVWDKPAAACLASRVPYGTPVTLGTLGRVAVAEEGLRKLGFAQLRVRHYGELARVELDPADLPEAVERRGEVVAVVRAAGYRYVTLDLEGFRSGNLNAALVS